MKLSLPEQILVGTATTLAGSVPSFAAGAALWSAALLLTSIPGEFALWVRLPGIIGFNPSKSSRRM
jgi:hypothetical protein